MVWAAARRDDLGPQHPSSADLGNRLVEPAADADAERDLLCRGVNVQPARGERPQVVDTGSEQERQILRRGRAGMVVGRSADLDGSHVRRVRGGPRGEIGHLLQGDVERNGQ